MPNNNDSSTIKHQEKQITLSETELQELLEQSKQNVIEIIQSKEMFSGPVPHPDHMKQYKAVDKSLPNRFTTMAEKSLAHKMWIEKFIVIMEAFMGILGWATPTVLSFYVLHAAIGFVSAGKNIQALISLIVALASLGGAFYMKTKNNNQKDK